MLIDMEYSTEHIILLTKQRHLETLNKLASHIDFVEILGAIIHQLQTERGASCLYLASGGKRFGQERSDIIAQNTTLPHHFGEALRLHLDCSAANAQQLNLVSWILLGFEQLTALRRAVTLLKVSFPECLKAYSQLINNFIALIFEITDNTLNSKISAYLVALYNLVHGKEYAGQERAVGAYMFGSGLVDATLQAKLIALIELQDRHFDLFNQFATAPHQASWSAFEKSALQVQHQALRQQLLKSKPDATLEPQSGQVWFDTCSQRLTRIWEMQQTFMQMMKQRLLQLQTTAQQELESTRHALDALQKQRDQHMPLHADDFKLSAPLEHAFAFMQVQDHSVYPIESIMALLQQQSQQIAEIEIELSETKQALSERKHIERAKGLLMQQQGFSEVEAYKWLRRTAMDQNRKLIEVAENVIQLYRQRA